MIVQIGEIYRTPFEPSGLVKVIEIERQQPGYPCATAFVEFIGDHPSGYKNGTNGRYFCDELRSTATQAIIRTHVQKGSEMLRAIFRRRMRDAVSGCEVTNQLFSFRIDVPAIENELRRGGFGESGYEIVELVGIEVEKPEDNPYLGSMFIQVCEGE